MYDLTHNKLTRRGMLRTGVGAIATMAGLSYGIGSASGQRLDAVSASVGTIANSGLAQRRPSTFIMGANYVGAPDRCWEMWTDQAFDLSLIDADFARGADAGLTTIRIFVQRPLAIRLLSADWARLDGVINIAKRRGVGLIVTLCDYLQPDVVERGVLNGLIAARYRNDPVITAYDLTNEPQWYTIVTGAYPAPVVALPTPTATATPRAGATPSTQLSAPSPTPIPVPVIADAPIIREGVISQFYGELQDPEEEFKWRTSQPFGIPERFGLHQRMRIFSAMTLLDQLNADMVDWLRLNPGASEITYLNNRVNSTRFAPLVKMLDESLGAWLAPQIDPIRIADPNIPVMCGYNRLFMAGLSANQALDLVSFHHYTDASDAAPQFMADVQGDLVRRLGRPTIWGEFGWSTYNLDPEWTADLEIQALQLAPAQGMVGGLKWMLNDALHQVNPWETFYGLYDVDGNPKPSARRFRQFRYG